MTRVARARHGGETWHYTAKQPETEAEKHLRAILDCFRPLGDSNVLEKPGAELDAAINAARKKEGT